jgi:alkylated DNA repair dioxygenase AlkB
MYATVDFISTDPHEPIVLVRDAVHETAVDLVGSLNQEDPAFYQDNHVLIADTGFDPVVYKKCGEIKVPRNSQIKDDCNAATMIAACECYKLGNERLGQILEESSKRKYWDGPALMIYGEQGGMSAHTDNAELDPATLLPSHDGFLVTTNLGLTCHFSFETRKGHRATVAVPSGSVLIFDAVLTRHAIHTIVPGTCPIKLARRCPALVRNRVSLICRQSLAVRQGTTNIETHAP